MFPRTTVLTVAILLLLSSVSSAGTGYPMKCSNCGFACRVNIGGGMMFDQLTGWCPESKKFVTIQWKRGEKKPAPMAKVWDSATGETIEVYKCPDCSKAFIPLRLEKETSDGPGFDHCPKCGKRTFNVDKTQGIMCYD